MTCISQNIVTKRFSPSNSLLLYTIGLIMVMYKSNRLIYARFFPDSLLFLSEILILLIYISYNYNSISHIDKFKFLCVLGICSIKIYDVFHVIAFNWYNALVAIISIFFVFILLSLHTEKRNWIFKIFNNCTITVLALAIIGWILFLFKIPMPHFTDLPDAYYIHTVYPFFNLNGYPEIQIVPRFAGPFLEPGHLGTMCVFILYCRGMNLKKISNLILLVSILLSLSLAAYGLLIGAAIIHLFIERRYIWLIIISTSFLCIGIGATLMNAGDNPINQAIVSRLEVDEKSGEIAGNNRTTGAFDRAYDKYLGSSDMLFGIGVKASGIRKDGADNILLGCATYKRYFYTRGIVGSLLIIMFLLIYFKHYRSKRGLGFVIIYIVANCIRDYPAMDMWINYYIMAIPFLMDNHHKIFNENKCLGLKKDF